MKQLLVAIRDIKILQIFILTFTFPTDIHLFNAAYILFL